MEVVMPKGKGKKILELMRQLPSRLWRWLSTWSHAPNVWVVQSCAMGSPNALVKSVQV
ncbi:hypothetical protein PAXRUDRAFT_13796 [Paxillus rubicundulus Ve08.2h10]|uniref:Uncharacterized protein n=1 Tax=Paxillus rubicundulus Ve08.2h10 TaxID=930991 RepID=A0A0D0DSW7_9AGAM|nr:hypothetical protein PAXRUDRAFT_13796 [Paxillus rubicundulus Ve08.2h10]